MAPGIGAHNIHITAGCNQAFVTAALAIAEPGSRLLLTNPFYFDHAGALRMFGVGVGLVNCPAERGFLADPAALEAAITPDVRAFAVVSPNNPTGAVYPPALLRALFEICRRKGIWFILDETYRDFLPPGAGRPHELFDDPDWTDTLISLCSFSKSFCIPGYRLGAVTASPRLVAEIAKIMDHLQICAPRIGQIALAEALPKLDDWREENRREIAARAAKLREVIAHSPGWEIDAIGAYFAYIRHPFRGEGSMSAAERLARATGVITIPGSYFGPGQEDHLRFAFANASADVIGLIEARLAKLPWSESGGESRLDRPPIGWNRPSLTWRGPPSRVGRRAADKGTRQRRRRDGLRVASSARERGHCRRICLHSFSPCQLKTTAPDMGRFAAKGRFITVLPLGGAAVNRHLVTPLWFA